MKLLAHPSPRARPCVTASNKRPPAEQICAPNVLISGGGCDSRCRSAPHRVPGAALACRGRCSGPGRPPGRPQHPPPRAGAGIPPLPRSLRPREVARRSFPAVCQERDSLPQQLWVAPLLSSFVATSHAGTYSEQCPAQAAGHAFHPVLLFQRSRGNYFSEIEFNTTCGVS